MGNIQTVVLFIVGSLLLYFGYSLFFPYKKRTKHFSAESPVKKTSFRDVKDGIPGMAKVCPLCSAELVEGERVKSAVFPALEDETKRMFIYGCPFCLEGAKLRERHCPVCGQTLAREDYLIAKLFPKIGRPHVHVQGCTLCRPSNKTKRAR